MTLSEFAERISPIPLSPIQKDILTKLESVDNFEEYCMVISPGRAGKTMMLNLMEEYKKMAQLSEQIKQNADKIAEILVRGKDVEIRKSKDGISIAAISKKVVQR
jgi:hypothetical protein